MEWKKFYKWLRKRVGVQVSRKRKLKYKQRKIEQIKTTIVRRIFALSLK